MKSNGEIKPEEDDLERCRRARAELFARFPSIKAAGDYFRSLERKRGAATKQRKVKRSITKSGTPRAKTSRKH